LEPPRYSYKDFAAWQYGLLTNGELKTYQDFWFDKFKNGIRRASFPVSQPDDLDFPIEKSCVFEVNTAGTKRLVTLSSSLSTTLFVSLLASVKALLRWYNGFDEIVVGTPSTGRVHGEVENIVGYFGNVLPLTTEISMDLTFAGLIANAKQTLREAITYDTYPLDRILMDLKDGGCIDTLKLFDVLVVMNTTFQPLDANGLRITDISVETQNTKYDVLFFFELINDRIQCRIEYNRNLFGSATISLIRTRLQYLLERFGENPNVKLSDVFEMMEDHMTASSQTLITSINIDL
jgi:non-ribosomal peptide synthetase component F